MSGPQSLTMQIEGMACASCVSHVEGALGAVSGVRRAQVNLATETAQVEYAAPAEAAALAGATGAAGYPAATAEATLRVSGMSCASCVSHVEAALTGLPGVLSAEVNLAAETARVRYLAGALDTGDLARAATGAGYPAEARSGEAEPEDRRGEEAARLRRQTLLAAALGVPVVLLAMGGMLVPGLDRLIETTIGAGAGRVVQFVLTTLILAGPGRRFFVTGVPALLRGRPEMNSLVAIGTAAAWGYSTLATFAPGLLPEGTRHVYFEAAAVITVLILLGRWMEARARGRTGEAVRRLVGLRPRSALVERGGEAADLPIGEIAVGDIVQLRPGERVAVDGEVLSGSSFVDMSMITGEPVPTAKGAGATVTGGTVNTTGTLRYRATHVGADTVLSQIIRMVEEAQGAKLPIQGMVDRVTAWFVPAVLVVAAVTVAVWLAVGPGLSLALVAGVAVLIVACPCAMGLATPTSIMVGTGRAAEMGVLFRRGDALQALQGCSVVALDKTGTLTEGRPDLTDLTVTGMDEQSFLRLLAAAEQPSEHPVAQALVRAAGERGIDLPVADAFESVTGHGVRATVEGHAVLIGAERLMTREGIALGDLAETGAALAGRGRTPLFAAIDGRAAGVLGVADPVKPSAPAAIAALQSMGLKTAMITGDTAATAGAIAREIGIDHVVAGVLPDGKREALRELSGEGRVAFVGDGINDAPALAEASVGIAIGTGTDVAIESADVVLMSGDPGGVVDAVEVSRRTMTNIRQNLVWAFGYNTLLIPVAAGVFYPLAGTMLSPMLAAGAMALSSVFVLSNALRLRRVRKVSGDAGPGRATGAAPAPAE